MMVPTTIVTIATGSGMPEARLKKAEVGGHHHDVAVREVDEAQDAEDERQAHGHERVEAARAQRVDDLLEQVVVHGAAPPAHARKPR